MRGKHKARKLRSDHHLYDASLAAANAEAESLKKQLRDARAVQCQVAAHAETDAKIASLLERAYQAEAANETLRDEIGQITAIALDFGQILTKMDALPSSMVPVMNELNLIWDNATRIVRRANRKHMRKSHDAIRQSNRKGGTA